MESHEPSYYEIALTNRQVVVAFVVLLVCVLTAFFSGVWIGRAGTLREREKLAANVPPPAVPAVDEEGREVKELGFFEEEPAGEPRGEIDPIETPPPAVDPAELEGGEAPPRCPRERGEASAEATPPVLPTPPSVAPTLSPAERREQRRQQRAALEASASPSPPGPPAAPGSQGSPPVPAAGRPVIQVLSTPDQAQAEKTVERLQAGGLEAFLSPVEVGGHTMYRVRVGPFASREAANKVAERIRKEFRLDTWVTE